MSDATVAPAESRFRPRVWPGVFVLVVAAGMLLAPPFIPALERTQALFMLVSLAPIVALGGGILWWVAASRAPLVDRLLVPVFFIVPFAVFLGEQLAAGRLPFAPLLYGVPFVFLLWVGWLVLSRPLPGGVRRAGVYAAVLLGWAAFGCVRFDQSDADLVPIMAWRWTPRAEDAFAARGERERVTAAGDGVQSRPGDWTAMRGPNRDGIVTGFALDEAAFASPRLVWKTEVGPGWGSFAVAGDRLYTLEQVGDREAVVCLDAATGKQIGDRHSYPAKFDDPQAGAGPRSTPTVADGRVYTMGATGILCCLNATDLKLIWTIDVMKDAGGARPMWGYACSPLVAHGLVFVYTGGLNGKAVTAFDAADGKVRWQGGQGTHAYSSLQLVTFSGVEQVLAATNYGVEAFDPKTGAVLWEHEWKMGTGNRTTQIPILGDGELLLTSGVGILGTKRLKVTKDAAGRWDVKVLWKSADLSPYFNDGVVYQNHYYGFSGMKFHCVDLATGEEVWAAPKGSSGKARFTDGAKYGNGQVILFAEQGLLLVTEARESLTETGSVFLLKATPDGHTELASFPGIKGKTWNHPTFTGGRLYLRNGVEAACYELPPKK
ncbi:MAG: PQQ-like beta-propeller repeat protein [Fimbriiglobus sp.]|jgi:outer membrane protein assembly factor BamB|nr:PQQ-like beta-propeller repeat protein [Fimbriiglobus sp.]